MHTGARNPMEQRQTARPEAAAEAERDLGPSRLGPYSGAGPVDPVMEVRGRRRYRASAGADDRRLSTLLHAFAAAIRVGHTKNEMARLSLLIARVSVAGTAPSRWRITRLLQ